MNATRQGTTPPAAQATPAPRFTVNAHGDAALQARMDAAAGLLEALLLGPAPVQPAPACALCHDTHVVGGTDRDGNTVDEACPACSAPPTTCKAVAA